MLYRILFFALCLSFMAGCSSSSDGDSGGGGNGDLARGPDWYMNYEDEEEGKLYGYGMSAGEQNPALAEASAKAAAREDMAGTINTLIQAMLERYLASTSNGKSMGEEMNTVQTLRGITNQSITGFRISKKEAAGKYLYVRGYLAMDELKKVIHDSEAINAALEKVRENAKTAFDRMDKILDEEAQRHQGTR